MNKSQSFNAQIMPEARAKRLKRLRNLANLSRKEIVEKYGININTLKGWEIARHGGLTEKGAKIILHILENEGVKSTLDWLLYGLGESPKVFEKNEDKASGFDSAKEIDKLAASEEAQISKELALFRKHNPQSIEYIIPDDSMAPHFAAGDYVAGIQNFGNDIAHSIGLNCIVQIQEGETLLRILRAGSCKEVYTLLCTNLQANLKEPIMCNVKLISAAPVIWQRRRNIGK